MLTQSLPLLLLPLLGGTASAGTSPYKPTTTACPSGASPDTLIRDGNTELSAGEAAYLVGRKPKADAALVAWLDKIDADFDLDEDTSMPTLALSSSGGGWRSMTVNAGVIQALDGRDSDVSTSGLLQAMSYHIGVSGGGWLVGSWAGNNFATVTEIKEALWLDALDHGLEFPDGWKFILSYAQIANDILSKGAAGYPISLTDAWARLLSYQFLPGTNGGVGVQMSDVRGFSEMLDFNAPIPIINSNGVDSVGGECDPLMWNGTVWEYNPFEFGSWDDDISAWIPIEYLGTAANDTKCTLGFDNLGFILGATSNLFAFQACIEDNPYSGAEGILQDIISGYHDWAEDTQFGRVPNPFKGHQAVTEETKEVFLTDELYMVDGGIIIHNDPVAPLLEPARNVDVILLGDASSDVDSFPTGQELIYAYQYTQNISRIASRFPTIPSIETFDANGYAKRAVFFGCQEPDAVTIVYLPNTNITYQSNVDTSVFQYDEDMTEGLISNGMAVATQDGDEGWGLCLACAIMMKTDGVELPEGCDACFEQYCHYETSLVSNSTVSDKF